MPKLIDLKATANKFQIINKGETRVEMLLYGVVGDTYGGISAKEIVKAISDLPKTVKNIDIRVNSPGGDVFEGVAIYERLKQHSAKVTAYVDGYAASIASVIIMAAEEIIISDAGVVMIHKPMSGVWGNASEMERMISILDKIEEQMISVYAKKTGKPRAEIAKELSDETWMTAAQAIENGFADKTFEASDSLQIAAMMNGVAGSGNLPWMKHAPKTKSNDEVIRAKLREFNAKMGMK